MNQRVLSSPPVRIALVLAIIAIHGASFGDQFENVRTRIRQYIEKESVPSVCVAAVRGSDVVWLESFGWSDVENRIAATPHTAYMLASLSKPITATAVMVAVEKNQLKLDGRINQYLRKPGFRTHLGDAHRITVRDVLMHQSGLPNHLHSWIHDDPFRPPEMNQLISQYGWTMIPYGEFHYSNLAFSSLASAISGVTGQTFSAYVHREVFVPLGMNDSFVPGPGQPRRAKAVRYGKNGRVPEFSTGMVPAAEIYSSAHDLARFAIFHMGGSLNVKQPVLSAAHVREMQESTIPIRFFHYRYGLGWSLGHDQQDRRHVFHGGGFAGCDAYLTQLPEEQVAVVFLSNKNRKWPGTAVSQDIVERTLAVLLDDKPESFRINYDRRLPEGTGNAAERFKGRWQGTLTVGKRQISMVLGIDAKGSTTVAFNRQSTKKVKNPEFIANAFFGTMDGADKPKELQTSASRLPDLERLDWDLRLQQDQLRGVLYVNAASEGNGYIHPHWVSLSRVVDPR